MNDVKILDCTLRDGGYLLNAKFGDATISGIIKRLSEARIDIIECGYLKDMPHEQGTCIFPDVESVIPYLPENRGNSSYTLFADFSRYKCENLKPYDGASIDSIRECFMKNERKDAMHIVMKMKQAGYKVFVQPVDILYYSDYELLELISWVNEIQPYSFSIVDTFGSMYLDDLQRVFILADHNLLPSINLGFHSHNNLQLSSALSQEFIRLGKNSHRNIVVDGTLCGMGRGAGNTCTELIAEFLCKKYTANYDLDALLDIIDIYMPEIQSKCTWGYSVPFLIAGMYNAHVHNISYLLNKHNIDTKNLRQIIEKVDPIIRKKYDYDNLERIYVDHISKSIDDTNDIEFLRHHFTDQEIILIGPGINAAVQKDKVIAYCNRRNTITISVNFIPSFLHPDFIFFSNYRRFESAKEDNIDFSIYNKIITSNIDYSDCNTRKVNYNDCIKLGWQHFDNALIISLRLLAKIGIKSVALAGFDGYTSTKNNYSNSRMEIYRDRQTIDQINNDIRSMLSDILIHSGLNFHFITDSLYG